MGNKHIYYLSEGAMMTALVGVALLINQQLAGLLEYAVYWVLSFPILIYTVRYGVKKALLPAVSMLLLSIIIAMPTTIFYFSSALLLGIFYGGGVRNKWSNKILLLGSGILTLISYFLTMVVFASLFGFDPSEDLIFAQKLLEMLHIGNVNIGQMVLCISLLVTVLTAFLQTICVHLFAVLILRRMKLAQLPTKSIFDFAFPKWIGYISICILVLFLLRNVIKLEGNLLIVVITAYMIMCIVLCGEVMMTCMSMCLLLQKRKFVFVCFGIILFMMVFSITRNIIILAGIYSCITRLRSKWKAGVLDGTFRKS